MEKGHVVLMSPDFTLLWSGVDSVGQVYVQQGYEPKMEVSWLPEYTEWPGFSIHFFLPWWHGHIPRWHCHDLSGSNCKKKKKKKWFRGSGFMRHHFHTWFHRVQTLTLVRIFGMCWRRLCTAARLSHHQYKILVKNGCNGCPLENVHVLMVKKHISLILFIATAPLLTLCLNALFYCLSL